MQSEHNTVHQCYLLMSQRQDYMYHRLAVVHLEGSFPHTLLFCQIKRLIGKLWHRNIWLYRVKSTPEVKKYFLMLALFNISYPQYYKLSLIITCTSIQSLMIIHRLLIELLCMTAILLQNWTFSSIAKARQSFHIFQHWHF